MAKQKLSYHFLNPNTAEETADYILKILIMANQPKLEKALKEAADEQRMKKSMKEGLSLSR